MAHQELLTPEEAERLAKFEKFLRENIPQFYYGIMLLTMTSIMSGNLVTFQSMMAEVAKNMDVINKGEGLA